MRPEHVPHGDPCERCGLAAKRHRKRSRNRNDYFRARRVVRGSTPLPADTVKPDHRMSTHDVIAIDGEGHTRDDGSHVYVYMAASTTDRLVDEIYDPNGLSTRAIFDFLLALPTRPKKVMFSAGYDQTMWFRDLPDPVIWLLCRPDHEARQGEHGPRSLYPTVDGATYAVNLVANKFTLRGAREAMNADTRRKHARQRRGRFKWKRRVTVLDFFKYFQCSFVAALERWDVGTPEERASIQAMKDRRGAFRGISEREKEYCRHETRLLAVLAEKLIDAVESAGLKPDSWYGPGSIASAMLKKDNARERAVEISKSMRYAVQCAFFGGRFEMSRCGPVVPAFSYDIASAYPTAETQLPCMSCGKWRHVEGDEREVLRAIKNARAACVHWSLEPHASIPMRERDERDERPADMKAMNVVEVDLRHPLVTDACAFGPFPFRTASGAILFPAVASGGWVWHFEFLAALAHPEIWPNVGAREAWIYESKCRCKPPFLKSVARDYARRLEWGKSGRGLVMKLGLNSRYGKRAQSSGAAPFHDLAMAGMITSHTRAAILDAIASARDPWDVVSIATDGIITTRPVKLRAAPKTGTERAAREATKRDPKKPCYPLGAWEPKPVPNGVHLIRPGMRFALDLPDNLSTTAARGLGIRVLHKFRARVLAQWKKKPRAPLALQQPHAFHGAKQSVTQRKGKPGTKFADDYHRPKRCECPRPDRCSHPPVYGRWIRPDPHRVAYDALPKRPGFTSDHRMLAWCLPHESESEPYDRFVAAKHNEDLEEAEDFAAAQPDGGYVGGLTDGDA